MCSTGDTVVSKPHGATEEVTMAVHRRSGENTHLLIAAAVAQGCTADLWQLGKALWKTRPVGNTIASQVRTACVTRASAYLRRVQPDRWDLVGAELPVGHAVADLVWTDPVTGDVVIDEIKSGGSGIDDPTVRSQVRRLYDGGRAEWGDAFVGVRLVPMRALAQTAIWHVDGDRIICVADDRLGVR
jgi:hypothetical protein